MGWSMAELFPLSDLRDPVAFLMGARVPIIQSFRAFHDIEWSRDRLIITLNRDDRRASIDTLRGEVMEIGLSLDLSAPDVARWCDRKIAEIVVSRMMRPYEPVIGACLGIHRRAWVVVALHADGRCYSWGFYRDEAQSLLSIPCTAANILTARAALIRALYGKEAT